MHESKNFDEKSIAKVSELGRSKLFQSKFPQQAEQPTRIFLKGSKQVALRAFYNKYTSKTSTPCGWTL